MNIACLIPIRLNSQRIKNKNFIKIKKQNLLELICKNISKSKYINNFFIASTSIKKIKSLTDRNKKILFFKRSKKSSSKFAKTELVIEEFVRKNNFDIIVLVQATNPFIKSKYIDEAIKKFKKKKYHSMMSVVKSKNFLWSDTMPIKAINYDYQKRKMSQKFKGHLIENGSFYIFYKTNFLKFKNRLHGKIGFYEMPKESVHEIDDYQDLKIIRKLL